MALEASDLPDDEDGIEIKEEIEIEEAEEASTRVNAYKAAKLAQRSAKDNYIISENRKEYERLNGNKGNPHVNRGIGRVGDVAGNNAHGAAREREELMRVSRANGIDGPVFKDDDLDMAKSKKRITGTARSESYRHVNRARKSAKEDAFGLFEDYDEYDADSYDNYDDYEDFE